MLNNCWGLVQLGGKVLKITKDILLRIPAKN